MRISEEAINEKLKLILDYIGEKDEVRARIDMNKLDIEYLAELEDYIEELKMVQRERGSLIVWLSERSKNPIDIRVTMKPEDGWKDYVGKWHLMDVEAIAIVFDFSEDVELLI